MYPQQPFVNTGNVNPYTGASAPSGYPQQSNAGQPGPAIPYPSQQPLQQQLPQNFYPQQQQQLTGPVQPAGPFPNLQGTQVPSEQQRQEAPLTAGATSSPPKGPGFMHFFRKQPSEANPTSPEQAASPQQAALPQGGSGGGQGSPERRGIFGIFNRSNAMTEQQQALMGQAASAPGTGSGGPSPSVGGAGEGLHTGVPVVPPASGLCSRAPPPADEVARLQTSPLAPSRFGLLNRSPSVRASGRSTSAPGTSPNAPAVDPQFAGPAPLEEKYGPFLRYGGYDPSTRIYSASVMMVVHQSRSRLPPTLKYRDTHRMGNVEQVKNPERLWSYAGYNFWRWDVTFQLGNAPAVAEYYVVCSEDHFFTTQTRYHFHLPAAGQKWHWGFYSCNGFHDPADDLRNGGIQPLWRDVIHVHAQDPIHVMFGGGDQLYCDDVWKVNSLLQWTTIQDKPSRNSHPFSQEMVNEVFDFYFRNYTTHFSKPVFRDALASIPQVMVWDDHDIFDGWGSYPPELQNCPVFAGVFFVARKFYLLFQNHASEDNYRRLNRGWGLTGLSWTMMLGNTTAVVGLDSRGERTRQQIIKPASWAAFSDQVAKLPTGVRHVVVLATVPLVYPTVPGIEEAMMALAGSGMMASALTAFLQKTGLSSQIYSQFGEPELLDDLLDHWSARTHEVEKYCFVRMMQDLAQARGFRFSVLSGDVHCAGVACFQTMPKVNLKADHRYITQVISSAIGNVPPPDGVIKALTASNKAKMLDPVTREKMRGIFENNGLLKAARNWCDIHERPFLQGAAPIAPTLAGGISGGPADGSLVFQLRVEHPVYKELRPYTYEIVVPVLQLPVGTFVPGPLPVAPPLPQPLMLKFQEELVAAGVGLDAALPVNTGAGTPSSPAAPPPGISPPLGAAPMAPAMAPVGSQQPFGLQSDIDQHQQLEQRGLPSVTGVYGTVQPSAPPAGNYYPQPPAPGPAPLLPVTSPPTGAAPPSTFAPPSMYGGVPPMPPSTAPGMMAYPPISASVQQEYAPQMHLQSPNYPAHLQQPVYHPGTQQPQQGTLPYPQYFSQPQASGSTPYPHHVFMTPTTPQVAPYSLPLAPQNLAASPHPSVYGAYPQYN